LFDVLDTPHLEYEAYPVVHPNKKKGFSNLQVSRIFNPTMSTKEKRKREKKEEKRKRDCGNPIDCPPIVKIDA
jgi:hypothetical protein